MFERFQIEVDSKSYEKKLEQFQTKSNRIAKRMMAKVSSEIKKASRKNLRGLVLKKGEGDLAKSLSYTARNNFTATLRSTSPYASTHEKGATINAKEGKTLTFMIDGKWVRVKSVTIPARPFLKPVIDDYWNSGKAVDLMDEILQKALDELFERGAI